MTTDAAHGDSIAVNGVCLTVIDNVLDPGAARTGRSPWSWCPRRSKRTSLSAALPGAGVNLERAVPAGARLGGHIVQGHVDGVATLLRRTPAERSDELEFSLPADLARYVVEKGSIAVDGVSLTVAGVTADTFVVALIPTTLSHTTLGVRKPGDTVNIEVDLIAKYVEKLVAGANTVNDFESIERAVADIKAGKAVVVVDDADRENEGDLIFAAELATPELLSFMVRYTSGYICVPLTESRVQPARPAADAPLERRPLPHRVHRDGRRQRRGDHRHLRLRPGAHDPPARRPQGRLDGLRTPWPCAAAAGPRRWGAAQARAHRGRRSTSPGWRA